VCLAFAVLFAFIPQHTRQTLCWTLFWRHGLHQHAVNRYNLALIEELQKNIGVYLLARMIYNDGKTAILIFGGVYAAGTFEWGTLELIIYGIILSIFAFGGGLLGGVSEDKFGSKNAIIIEISGTMIGLGLAL
jgi:MFS-type transporter involved in bile tolerance (Atg22 family)